MPEANFMTLSPTEKKLVRDHRKKLKKGRLLKCKKCSHVWIYGGKKTKGYTSCPDCLRLVHVEKQQVKE